MAWDVPWSCFSYTEVAQTFALRASASKASNFIGGTYTTLHCVDVFLYLCAGIS